MIKERGMYEEKSDDYFGYARPEIAPLLPGTTKRVLELGCGSGATLKWLRAQRPVEYAVGIEMSPEASRRAASVFDLVLTNNVETMELPDGGFDLILALDVLEHLVDPWTIVRRLHGLLAPGGVIIASLPNVGHYSVVVPLIALGRWTYATDGLLDRTHLRFFTRRTAIELMTSSGLVMDKIASTRMRQRRYAMKILGRVLDHLLPARLAGFQFLVRVKTP
jgi:SAM-dependent methyltransferase